MKKAHPLLWFGVGGILAYAIGEFLKIYEMPSMINYYIWSSLILSGAVLTAKQKKQESSNL